MGERKSEIIVLVSIRRHEDEYWLSYYILTCVCLRGRSDDDAWRGYLRQES